MGLDSQPGGGCAIFFDYDFVYGDKALVDTITEAILKCR
jgi:signal-transduction protein with cAMP-binding, CBS, and nucleotidyltransferase domain